MNEITEGRGLSAYILAKNEQANIGRCLEALSRFNIPINVLDSGSNDGTMRIASTFPLATVIPYKYESHCIAYNGICTPNPGSDPYVMILDADMLVSQALMDEILELIEDGRCDVVRAPVQMYVEGQLLPRGSLYPPKAIVFRIGKKYFMPTGHGETLVDDCTIAQTHASLIHDDRKEYGAYLESQLRYSQNIRLRAMNGALSARDVIRLKTPLMIFGTPIVSYFLKFGVLSGKAGLIYAIDRLIAEAIIFRQALAARMKRPGTR